MRSAKSIVGLFFFVSILLAAGNLWFAASRSTIFWALDTVVSEKATRFEKHRGKDDVYLFWLDGDVHQVDQRVYDAVHPGCRLHKMRFSMDLRIDGKVTRLAFSRDTFGMSLAMPLVLLVVVFTGWFVCRLPICEG